MKLYTLQSFSWDTKEIRINLFFSYWEEEKGNSFKYKWQFFTSYAMCSSTKFRGIPSSPNQKFRLLEEEARCNSA